jgi:hypothetical protein
MSIDIRGDKSFRDCFPKPVANRRDLVIWIAEIVYPSEFKVGAANRRKVTKRVKKTVADHAAKGAIKDLGEHTYNVADFFEWACARPKWAAALSTVPDITKNATVDLAGLDINAHVGVAHTYTVPRTYEEAVAALNSCRLDCQAQQERILQLESENQTLQEKLRVKAEHKKRSSEHGKKGAGVKRGGTY